MKLWITGFVFAVVALVVVTIVLLHPPNHMSIAAGPKGGAYFEMAERYRSVLARDEIALQIVETAGSVENAELLNSGAVDAAFLQGGIAVDREMVEAIGSVFFEPMMFLVRDDSTIPRNPALWSGLRINSGAPGSGTEAAFRDFERAVGLSRDDNLHREIPYTEAVAALVGGELDVATFVSPIDAPYLQEAYHEPSIEALVLDHAEAISRNLEYATVVTVPAGGMSLDPVLPPGPRELIALEARLVAHNDLHPALVNRLAMAAIELHRGRGIITDAARFPKVEGTGLVVNNAARQLIQQGPTTWHDWLPFWVAAQINRVLLLFLPFVFIVVPLMRLLPLAYAYLMRMRVWQYYPEIRRIEEELLSSPEAEELEKMKLQLKAVDDRLASLRMPAPYRQAQYDARLHLEMIQKRISDMQRLSSSQ